MHNTQNVVRRGTGFQTGQDGPGFGCVFVQIFVIETDPNRVRAVQDSSNRIEQFSILRLEGATFPENLLACSRHLLRSLSDPAAADHDVTVVEDRGLAGRDGALGLVEGDEDCVLACPFDHRCSWLVAMANLYRNSHRLN